MNGFFKALQEQRWDDHRYYHHSRLNQSLHLVSAIGFVVAYIWLFIDPVVSALIGWLFSMATRQSGHFFFEPLGYDEVNQVTNDYKEAVKVGFNLRRKVVLIAIWAAVPLLIAAAPGLFGLFEPHSNGTQYLRQVGTVWLYLGVAGLLFRTVHLFFLRDVQTGLVWFTKILTDPFHDIWLYHKAPAQLLRGEWFDPGHKPKA